MLLNKNVLLYKIKSRVEVAIFKQTKSSKRDYAIRINASLDCCRFLLGHGLPFWGHDESDLSTNQGLFLELLNFLAAHNETINNVVLKNAPEKNKMTSPEIQKDLSNASAVETTNLIIKDLGDEPFAILVDESRDVSTKEQMAVVIHYVNNKGCIVERFLGIVHVSDTTALSLKKEIEQLLGKHGLSLSRLRGQGYDRASNMRGEFNSLKSLILKENRCAFFVHCFAHQLQLTLVAVAKNHILISNFFTLVSRLVNMVGGSCKRRDKLRDIKTKKVNDALLCGDISRGRGLNQETGLQRLGDTRWGSHYGTLLNLIVMFEATIEVLQFIVEDGMRNEQKSDAYLLLEGIVSFEFILNLHLIKKILGLTNELSQMLQRKDLDIVNAVRLVKACKRKFQEMRDGRWESLLVEVSSFCAKLNVEVPDMDSTYVVKGRPRRDVEKNTNIYHYRVELFYMVIDMQVQELNDRFSEANTELLLCVSCYPADSFSAFDKQKLIRLAEFYAVDFSPVMILNLQDQLDIYT